jgi:UDP-N-acetylglucosamine 2-epimerase (non-hydrolysing)
MNRVKNMHSRRLPRLLIAFGTRPEAIKLAPVILALKEQQWCEIRVLATGQHRQELDRVLRLFEIAPDVDLNVMQPNQSLSALTARLVESVSKLLNAEQPDAVLVQGDTTTTMAVALACFYEGVPVGHIEAGLRTWDLNKPFPEELNRTVVGKLATWHFAPTDRAMQNLLREGVPEEKIFITGNTGIDSLSLVRPSGVEFPSAFDHGKRYILITIHRRESFGNDFDSVCKALFALAVKNSTVNFIFPVHPNPNVKAKAYELLSGLSNFYLCEPLGYGTFVQIMRQAYLILTDSGGVQEEAPHLGVPVLVLRNETERIEAISQGVVKLIGVDSVRIQAEVQVLLDDELARETMAKKISPYGDGRAAQRIARILRKHFLETSNLSLPGSLG